MPNTFVHLGVQSAGTKFLAREADIKWIAIGCIIPDVPWIIQRIIINAGISVDRFALIQYATVQASLFFCLLLSAAIAYFSVATRRLFLLLSANSLLHLLLDALQIKWANGVHLFAPFSWELVSFDLFWPEHPLTYVFTAAGFAAFVYFGVKDWKKPVGITTDRPKYVAAALLLAVYFCLPLWLRFGPEQADNHYVSTLRQVESRSGRYLEIDRGLYESRDQTVRIFSGERFRVSGDIPAQDAVLSVKGIFLDRNTIQVSAFHIHGPVRDASSLIALALVLGIWLAALAGKKIVFAANE